jgi:NAD(P)-dependent dehydrogenase (short-subunit alcohol dehydrogenase family)
LTDRVIIITGGSRGIGRATAIAAAARGFKVCVGYVANQAAARDVVATIEAKNGKAIAVRWSTMPASSGPLRGSMICPRSAFNA